MLWSPRSEGNSTLIVCSLSLHQDFYFWSPRCITFVKLSGACSVMLGLGIAQSWSTPSGMLCNRQQDCRALEQVRAAICLDCPLPWLEHLGQILVTSLNRTKVIVRICSTSWRRLSADNNRAAKNNANSEVSYWDRELPKSSADTAFYTEDENHSRADTDVDTDTV